MDFKFTTNQQDEDNARIHEQCEKMMSLVGDAQVALVTLCEFDTVNDGIHAKATMALSMHADKDGKLSKIALVGALVDNMTKDENVRDIILGAAFMYELQNRRQKQMS